MKTGLLELILLLFLWVEPVAELLAIVEICVQTLYPTKLFPF